MDWVMYSYLLAINRQIFLMTMSFSVGICVTVAGFLVIPTSGFVSLPYMQAATELTLFLIQLYYLGKLHYRSFHITQLGKPLLAAGFMGITLFVLGKFNLFGLVATGAIVYFLALYLLKGLGDQEMSILRRFVWRQPDNHSA